MNSTLTFKDIDIDSLKQNFSYHSNLELNEELLKTLNYSGFSESEIDFDFTIESGEPLIIKLDDHIIELTDTNELKDLLSFRRELHRQFKIGYSLNFEASNPAEVTTFIEKVYSEVDHNFINALFKLYEIKSEFQVLKIKKSESFLYSVEEDFCFEDQDHFYLLKIRNVEALNLIPAIAEFVRLTSANEHSQAQSQVGLSELINQLNYPVVILNDDKIVSYHNDLFSKLNITPNHLLASIDSDWIDIEDQKYKILFSQLGHLKTICLVKQEFNYTKSHSELGIITSSIAHELNNPLAGILAAINMLELEDWEEEDETILKEMKASANRCKNLIHTFLGFARVKDQLNQKQNFSEILQQSISLLSNRKIESGISIDTKVSRELEETKVSGASLPIILYLILSEMMTLKNHELLIGDSTNNIECSFSKIDHDIILNVKNLSIEGQKNKILNRLITHLLGLENSKVQISAQDIIIQNLL